MCLERTPKILLTALDSRQSRIVQLGGSDALLRYEKAGPMMDECNPSRKAEIEVEHSSRLKMNEKNQVLLDDWKS